MAAAQQTVASDTSYSWVVCAACRQASAAVQQNRQSLRSDFRSARMARWESEIRGAIKRCFELLAAEDVGEH